MIFLVSSGKMIFLFSKNIILHLRQKMKDDLSQKNTQKYYIFFKPSEKMVFRKRAALGHDLSCIIWKDGIFSPKTCFFPWAERERWPFSKNTWKYDIFCIHERVLQTWRHAPLSKKNQRWSYPAKIHLKVTDVVDWHPRKSSSNSLYFREDLYRRFHVLLSSDKNQKT